MFGLLSMACNLPAVLSGCRGCNCVLQLASQVLLLIPGVHFCLLSLQYAFNLFSHNSGMDTELGYNEEELKMVKETKKIWGTNDVAITATCVRVPVMRAHAESINLEFAKDISEKDALDALQKFPGVSIIDDRWAHVDNAATAATAAAPAPAP